MKRIVRDCLKTLYSEQGALKIKLRPILDSDTDNILRWRNSASVKSNFIYRRLLTAETHLNWLQNNVYVGKAIQYIIEVDESNFPIGSIYLRDIDLQNESGELGIFIGEKEYIAKGYGKLAIKTFIPLCFSLGFHRVFLRVFKDNILAQKAYLDVGFTIEGIARDMVCINGKRKDVIFMSLTNDF